MEISMEQSCFYDKRFYGIQVLRGITALFIVLEHIRFLNCGAFGVDIFFCISGFMIMFSTQKDTSHFLSKRLIRILPLYYLMTLGTFFLLLLFPNLFATSTPKIEYLVKSLLFLPFDIGDGAIQPLMRVGWTIQCEIFFYLLFRFSLWISHRFRGLVCSLLLAGFVLAARFFPAPSLFLSFYGAPVMLEFILGILCFYLARLLYTAREKGKLPAFCKWLAFLLIFGIYLYFLITKPTVNILGFRRPLIWGIPAALLVLAFFLLEFYVTFPPSMVLLGNSSFSIYLLHYYPVVFLDRKLFDFGSFSPASLAGVCVALIVSVLLGLLSYELIERRFSGWLRKKLLR